MGMLQNQNKIEMEPNTGVTFEDVAGCDSSKLELVEVVDFLKYPEKFTKRIRNLFGDAKKNAPCIIFIDEIDAIGRQRSGGGGFATNDEREQTLNQILTEMDGFSGNSGVIVLAATNRGDILDSALLRPGRFDRRVPVDLPDKDGRVEILACTAATSPSATRSTSANARTIGFSGASLQNLMNEAAIMAARRSKDSISFSEIDYAIDRLTVGLAKTTGMNNPSRQRLVAYHEAGHAIMAALTEGYDTVAKLTIIPVGFSGRAVPTAWEPAESGGMFSASTAASEETESTIDTEVSKLVADAYEVCKKALGENRALMDATVDALLEKETIDGVELDVLLAKYTGSVLNKRPEVISV
ncbi:metalloendopeptidase [Aureococcus anophagefferens]|nr:metalloendopeptidase [Aureococcus anophagefferens]